MWKARLAIALLVVVGPGVLLAPVWRLGGLGAGEDDILYYYPARLFFHESLQSGAAPWWNPWTGLGRPFFADPQSGLWYPPTLLFAVLPPEFAYPAVLWLHYSLAIWGMYRLLRAQGLARAAAGLGGLVFAFGGFMLAHRAHFTMQHAAAWTPLLFWRVQRYVASPPVWRGGARTIGRLAAAAIVLALQALAGHVQVVALTVLGLAVFLLFWRPPASAPFVPAAWKSLPRLGLVGLCAAGLFAVQLVPTALYLPLCTRTERTFTDFVENSWHPVSVLTWLAPFLPGQRTPNLFPDAYWGPSHQVEQLGYVGLAPLLLALAALRAGWRYDAGRRGWVFLGGFAALLALGQYGPICPLLYWIPGSSLFRCPARALLLVQFAAAVLAATTFGELLRPLSPDQARLRYLLLRATARPWRLALLVALAAWLLALVAIPFAAPLDRPTGWHALRPWNPALLCAAGLAVLSGLALRAGLRRWQRAAWLALVPLVTALDLGLVGWHVDVPAQAPSSDALRGPGPGSAWLDLVRTGGHRLWVVTARAADGQPGEYIRSLAKCVANTNILRGIPTLTDYGPLQPRAFVQRFGMQPWGESWKAAELLADTDWMRLYDVGWVLICDDPPFAAGPPPPPAGCEFAAETPVGRLYRNPSVTGPVLYENAAQSGALRLERPAPDVCRAWVDTWPPGRRATAAPVRAVFAESALPGWTVRVNGGPAVPGSVDGVISAVEVSPGLPAEIEWRYEPPGLRTGATISLSSALLLLLALAAAPYTRRRP